MMIKASSKKINHGNTDCLTSKNNNNNDDDNDNFQPPID